LACDAVRHATLQNRCGLPPEPDLAVNAVPHCSQQDEVPVSGARLSAMVAVDDPAVIGSVLVQEFTGSLAEFGDVVIGSAEDVGEIMVPFAFCGCGR
jgi:hypothetical protein